MTPEQRREYQAEYQRKYRRRKREGTLLLTLEITRDELRHMVLSGEIPGRHTKNDIAAALLRRRGLEQSGHGRR